MKPLHPQVRIVTNSGRTGYYVELYDGNVWERTSYSNFLRDRAEQHARWLSDVLEHARDVALEEAAAKVAESEWWGYEETQSIAADIRAMKGVRDA